MGLRYDSLNRLRHCLWSLLSLTISSQSLNQEFYFSKSERIETELEPANSLDVPNSFSHLEPDFIDILETHVDIVVF